MVADAMPGGKEQSLLTPRFALVMAAGLAYFMAIGATLPTLPRFVSDELGGGGLEVGIGVGAFAVSAALVRPWVGRLGDTKGRRLLAVSGAAIVAVSILGYGLATSLPILVVARLLTGLGEAAAFVGLAAAAQDLAPDHRRGEAASYFSVALYGGLAIGPFLGETLTAHGFWVVWGAASGAAALAALVSLGLPVGRTVAEVGDRNLLQPDALWPGLLLLLGLIPITAFVAFAPLFADEIGFGNMGPVFAVFAGLVLVIRIFGARLPDRLGWRTGVVLALSGVTTGIWLIAAWGAVGSIWAAAIGLALGQSLLYPALFTAVMAAAPEEERSHAIATFSVFFDISHALGAPMIGAVVSLSSLRGGFGAAGAVAMVGLMASWLLREHIGRRRLALAPSEA